MNLRGVLMYIKGYAEFEADEGFSDKFLNMCRESGAGLHDITSTGGVIHAKADYMKLDNVFSAAEKSGMTLKILRYAGIPYILKLYRMRIGIPLGIICAFIIFNILSSVVWSVDISGYERINESDIVAVLDDIGIKRGVFTATVDTTYAEEQLMNRIDGILWVAVNITGSKVFVDVRETIVTPNISEDKTYVNIIASDNGEVVKADILAGDGKIAPGTPVVKGDLLVSGVITLKDNTVRFVHAKAEITARTTKRITCSTALKLNVNRMKKCRDRYSVYIFGIKIPFGIKGKYNDSLTSRYFADSFDSVFPLGIIRECFCIYEKEDLCLSDNEAKLLCLSDFAVTSVEKTADAEICERTLSVEKSNQFTVESKYICLENIAEEQVFEVEEQNISG